MCVGGGDQWGRNMYARTETDMYMNIVEESRKKNLELNSRGVVPPSSYVINKQANTPSQQVLYLLLLINLYYIYVCV